MIQAIKNLNLLEKMVCYRHHRFRLTLADKLDLEDPNINMALANLSIYYTWKNIKSAYYNNKFKISAPTWNGEFDFPDRSYSILDIQDYFECIIKKHESIADNSLCKFMRIK